MAPRELSQTGWWSQLMRLRLSNRLDNAKGREIKDDWVGNLEIDTIKVHQVSWWGSVCGRMYGQVKLTQADMGQTRPKKTKVGLEYKCLLSAN